MRRQFSLLIGLVLLGSSLWTTAGLAQTPTSICKVETNAPTLLPGQRVPCSMDTSGNLRVAVGGSGGGFGTNTAAAPSRVEGSPGSFSFDLNGNARVTPGTLLFGEDSTNNLMMTSGGAVRITQLVGTGGIPSTASDATGTANILPVGLKTFHGIVTCTGTCVQTQKIYGSFESSATVGKSILVCTLTISASTTATDYCSTDRNFSYWFVVTSLTSGTTPLAGLFAMY